MNKKYLRTLISVLALAVAICPQAWAACPWGYTRNSSSGLCEVSACSGKCTYYYNDTTYDFEAKVNPDVPAGTPVLMNKTVDGMSIHNATVGEGITGFDTNYVFFNLGSGPNGRGTLTLPSTFKSDNGYVGIHTGNFANYDLSAVKNANLVIGSSSNYNVIMNDDANLNVRLYCPYGYCASSINLVCKGNKADCRKQFPVNTGNTAISASYYTGLDEKGNWIEWSDDGLSIYADSSKAKLLGTYDFDGNQTEMYRYDGAGNLTAAYKNGVAIYTKTLYTLPEAAAAVKKDNSNTVTITFK